MGIDMNLLRANMANAMTSATKQNANAVYPFWQLKPGQSADIRFIEDPKLAEQGFFWGSRELINLTFPAIKGKPDSKKCSVKVPTISTWQGGKGCRILATVQEWFELAKNTNDDELETFARRYWKKKSWILQGFVRRSDYEEAELPENPIRKFVLSKQLFAVVKQSTVNPQLMHSVSDVKHGRDLTVNVVAQDRFNNYQTSQFSFNETELTGEELAAIEQYGAWDIESLLPQKPDEEHQQAAYEMFEASANAEPYDPEKWARYYRPFGVPHPDGDSSAAEGSEPAVKPKTNGNGKPKALQVKNTGDFKPPKAETAPVEKPAVEAVEEEQPKPKGPVSATDVLAKLNKRKAEKAAEEVAAG